MGRWAAALALTELAGPAASAAPAAPAAGPTVSVAEGADYAALVKTVLAPLGGMAAFVKSGNRVVVKPNIGWDRTPELAATTHPAVVKTLVQLALDAGASQVLPPVVSGNAVPSPGPSVRPAHVLLPVKTAPPPAAAPNFAPAFTPPGARPERLQSFG